MASIPQWRYFFEKQLKISDLPLLQSSVYKKKRQVVFKQNLEAVQRIQNLVT